MWGEAYAMPNGLGVSTTSSPVFFKPYKYAAIAAMATVLATSANLVLPGITSHYKLRDPCYSVVTEGYGMLCSTTRGYGVLCSKTKVC